MAMEEPSLFRSVPMEFVRMVFPKEAAHGAVKRLGFLERIQLVDLNEDKPATAREHAAVLQRCAEVDRVLRYFDELFAQFSMAPAPAPAPGAAPAFQSQFADLGGGGGGGGGAATPATIEELEALVARQESYLSQLCANLKELRAQRWRSHENILALELAAPFFGQQTQVAAVSEANPLGAGAGGMEMGLLGEGRPADASGSLSHVVGVVTADRCASLEKILYRATRGNIVVRYAPIAERVWDEGQGREVEKAVFVGFLQGHTTYAKVQRICEVVGAQLYEYDQGSVRSDLDALRGRLKESTLVVSESERQIRATLGSVAESYNGWTTLAAQESAIYEALNRFKYTGGGESGEYVVAEGWIPAAAKAEVRGALDAACSEAQVGQLGATLEQSQAPHGATVPPTHFVTNKYTAAFQAIVEAYGVARYREHNPTVYTLVTFPFLFAVMFGDLGHGLLLLAVAVYMILNEKEIGSSKVNEMVQTPFDGRYVLFLMSFFSLYCGLLYNELFGMPLSLYGGTRWHFGVNETMAGGWKECFRGQNKLGAGAVVDVYGDASMNPGCNLPPKEPYPIGMDPMWKYSSGGLIYFNSLKMKMSVVFGVFQMVCGIIVKATNDIKHKRPLDIWCEFVPQMIFMNGIFGYMVLLVIVKWNMCWVPASHFLPGGELVDNAVDPVFANTGNAYYAQKPAPYCAPYCIEGVNVRTNADGNWIGYSSPPDIKQILITMFMSPAEDSPLFNLFDGMHGFHTMLVPLVMLMPLIMLLPKPLVLNARAKAGTLAHDPADPHDGEEFEFGEVFIHQVIETIEFVLGAISNTASYLRLWALSLAHSQLTDVFFEKALGASIEMAAQEGTSPGIGALAVFVAFAVWLVVTFAVLLVMESLSAVLHALRLHWVEFQNKFYKGDGVKFVPFSFAVATDED